MTDILQYQQQTEMEHRLWAALDALTSGTWTPDDIALVCYATGLQNYLPPTKEQIDPPHAAQP